MAELINFAIFVFTTNFLMLFLYNFSIFIYSFILKVASRFNPKANLWVNGRKDLFVDLKKYKKNINQPLIWIHCASLGEFEQGRPIIEGLKEVNPDLQIILTFFSPSGYEIQKNYPLVNAVFYLPLDTHSNAKKFLYTLKPDLAIFVKYEFWYHHLATLKSQNIPTILISSIFTKNQIFFQFYGGLHRKMLSFFTAIFVQNKESLNNLQNLDIEQVILSGDTRIDRVLSIVNKDKEDKKVELFATNHPTIICGSTWGKDEELLSLLIDKHSSSPWKFIIAPHEIDEKRLVQIEQKIKQKTIRYSIATDDDLSKHNVLIIDNIGLLSSIYKYGNIAYIGGGFGAGIHNTLEPIAFGLPVIFGQKYQKFEEAKFLVKSGGGFSITNKQELFDCFERLNSNEFYKKAGQKARQYIVDNEGSSKQVITHILDKMK